MDDLPESKTDDQLLSTRQRLDRKQYIEGGAIIQKYDNGPAAPGFASQASGRRTSFDGLRTAASTAFEAIVNDWLAVTHILNNLSRGRGQKDLYPFVLSYKAIAKLERASPVQCRREP